jgi:hypothetical protein
MGGHQRIASDLRSHLAIAQDEMRQNREYRFARGALETPNGDSTEPETEVMRVTRQAPTAATGGLVLELKPEGEDDAVTNSRNALPSPRS